MRQRQLLTCGLDDKLVQQLHELVQDRGVGVRACRQADACLNLLRQGAVGVLVLRVGRNLESEYQLLAQATEQFLHVAVVVVGDVDHPQLAGLAWDFGARCVLAAPVDPQRLRDVIVPMLGDEE